MKAALKEAVQQIKQAGFSHIKVELEGDIGRDGNRECSSCSGEGRNDCDSCEGSGVVNFTDDRGNDYENECAVCDGDGRTDCETCEGNGTSGNYMDEDTCDEFMRQWVREHHPEVRRRLTFGRFYEDGSVDSEFTFTVPIDNVEDVIVWIESFKALAEESGNGNIDVSGAGLHISLIPEYSGGVYPCYDYGHLDNDGLNNFVSEVSKLLPALFFLASSNHQSRELGYRHASIGSDKYNAISTHDGSCLEYRVFETCYDHPDRFFDYVKVIANTIKFYADPSLKVKALGKKFGFTDGDECARFFSTPEQLRILNATVKHLKPKDKSFKKLKEERGVRYTIKSLAAKEKVRLQQLREEYREYRRRWLEINARPLTANQQVHVDELMLYNSLTRREAEAEVRGLQVKLLPLAEFIANNIVRAEDYQEIVNI